MEGGEQMKITLYGHCDGLNVVSADLINDIEKISSKIHPSLRPNSTSEIKNPLLDGLWRVGWSSEIRVSLSSKITITGCQKEVGLCLQTGNVSRVYADLLKLQAMYLDGLIIAGIILLPTAQTAQMLASNMANSDRLVRELPIFKKVITLPLVVVGLEGMED